jgi:protein-disulfide isomerase
MRDGVRAQVGGTPSVFLNGQRYQGPRGYPPEGLEAVSRVYLGLGQ